MTTAKSDGISGGGPERRILVVGGYGAVGATVTSQLALMAPLER
ncbi:hypothetical protein [Streptomyces flaveus]